MPKQSTVATGRRGRDGVRKARARRNNQRQPAFSANNTLPATETLSLIVRLKVDLSRLNTAARQSTPALLPHDSHGEMDTKTEGDIETQEARRDSLGPGVVTTRSGRNIKQPSHKDWVVGDEMEREVDSISDRKITQPRHASTRTQRESRCTSAGATGISFTDSDPSITPNLTAQGQSPTQPFASFSSDSRSLTSANRSSSLTITSLVRPPRINNETTDLVIHQSVLHICQILKDSSKICVNLPSLPDTYNPHIEQAYTGTFLTHLYILCYDNKLWNLCDLVSDTWIRAFHALRTKDKKHQLWRPNPTQERRMRDGWYKDGSTAQHDFTCIDPLLANDVTAFNASLLNALYTRTAANSGARLLWADAMALAGSKTDDVMEKSKLDGEDWHEDLVYEIMSSSLRLVRAKATLKIEEPAGEWCKRYHEHGKHGQACYREVAWERQMAEDLREGLASDEIGGGGVGGGGGVRGSAEKRVRFEAGDSEMVDVDAEGASEEE